jgi:murein DD-endopeptidase MepM/ murein hydrolase activator NlpD
VLASPVPGARITSNFGSRYHPIFHEWRTHTGVDFGAGSGTPIRAAADGEVAFAGARGGYGNATILDHGGSLATLYAHQSAILVRPGQAVRRGQVIGRVGSTGYSTGPHLHFEVRVAGTPVDPRRYL